MSIRSRAITSAQTRLAQAEHNLSVSAGNDKTIRAKRRKVEVRRYILAAVISYGGDEQSGNEYRRDCGELQAGGKAGGADQGAG